MLRTRHTIRPGQPGSKRFVERYGDSLVCVRYRRDEVHHRILTTVELVVDDRPFEPDDRDVVGVRVRLDEPVLRGRVRAAGGDWDRERRLWMLPRGAVTALGLEDRLVELAAISGNRIASVTKNSTRVTTLPPPQPST